MCTMESREKEYKRESWSHSWEFLLTCIGYAVGLSNIWRFPYLCYMNGGGVFLIPYLLTVFLCGIPIACMEFSLGQYVGLGLFPFWEICPLFKGIGLTCLIVNIGLASYFIFVVVLALYYLFASFSQTIPWKHCSNTWNTDNCYEFHSKLELNFTALALNGDEEYNSTGISRQISPAEEYLTQRVLKLSEGLEEIGTINWQLLLFLVVAWLAVYLTTIRGVQSAGKVVYFTATFPYLMLTAFLIRGLTLPGALNGIKFYMLPRWEKLLEPQVWYNAVQQVFISLGVAYGCFMTLASYNKFNNNCYRDAAVTTLINSATSIYGGFSVFAVLGFMAHELNLSIDDVVRSGPGLAFVAYPLAMATMPLSQLWSVLFFMMLVVLGVGSEIVHFESVISCITDQFPSLRLPWRRIVTASVVGLAFLASSVIYITNGGMYVFTLIDWYCTPLPLMIAAVVECIVFPWLYGVDTITANTREMIGITPNIYLKICWKYLAPVFILIIMVVNTLTWTSVTYGNYKYPIYANVIGWIIAIAPLLPILLIAIYKIWKCDQPSLAMRIRTLIKPSDAFYRNIENRSRTAAKENTLYAKVKELDTAI